MYTVPRTAYILQIHKNPEQVNMFIDQLISEELADVYVHIDKKNYEELNGKIIKNPNVKVLDKNINCEWGDISQIDTTILLLREVLASRYKYDFVCLRSGQDLLVKNGFKDFLLNNKGNIYMMARKIQSKDLGPMKIRWPKVLRRRYNSLHLYRTYRKILLILYRIGINIFPNFNDWPKDFSFYSGSQWFTIPSEVASYIIEFLDQNEWFYTFYKNSLVPDEWFFHTLIMNSPFKSKVVNNNLLLLKWGETIKTRNSPQDLKIEDIKLIEESKQFFARKFDRKIDQTVVEYFTSSVRFGGFKESFKNEGDL
jgi:hypothetical protein